MANSSSFERMPTARLLSAMMLAVLLSGCASPELLTCPESPARPSALYEKKTPDFEAWSSEVSAYFREVEKAIATPPQTTTP